MKAARIVVLGVALSAGLLAAVLAGRSEKHAVPAPVKPTASLDTVDVLVARSDLSVGQTVAEKDLQWQIWPTVAAGPSFIRKSQDPNAIKDLSGSIARSSFATGEPIRESKLIKAHGSGFLAAILPSGMRAISTDISAETGAGGFILPNDHVDVILSRRRDAASGSREAFTSDTILSNVTVLAIDQTIGEKDGQKVVIGKTATLELSPGQAETLAVSRQLGTLSLALRSIADNNKQSDSVERPRGNGINVVRYGVGTNAAGK